MSEIKKKVDKSIKTRVLMEHDNSFTRDENMKLPTIRVVQKKQVKSEIIETKETRNARNKTLLNKKISTMNKRNTIQSNLSAINSTPNIVSKTQGMINKKKNMSLKKQNSTLDSSTINNKNEIILDKISEYHNINNDNNNISIKRDDTFIDPMAKFFKVSNYKIDNFSPEHSPFGKGNTESYERFLENQKLNEIKDNNPEKLNKIKKNKTTSLFIKAVKGLPNDKAKALLSSIADLENNLLDYEDDLYDNKLIDNIDRYEQIDNIEEYSADIQDWSVLKANLNNEYEIVNDFDNNDLADDQISIGSINSGVRSIGSVNSMNSLSSKLSKKTNERMKSVINIYESAMKYSRSIPEKGLPAILWKIGKAMASDFFKDQYFNYDRGVVELCGPTMFRGRILQLLQLLVSTKEVKLIFIKFDVDNTGHVDLISVLGNAKLIYEKQINEERSAEEYKKALLENRDLAQENAERTERRLKKLQAGDSIEEINKILKLLADVSLEMFKNNKTSLLNELKSKSNFKEFHSFLHSIGLVISIRQEKILERRYNDGNQNNTICMKKFRSEFISIGKKKIKELKQKEAINSFITSLSRGEQRKNTDNNNTNNFDINIRPSSSPTASSPKHINNTHEYSPRNLIEKEKHEREEQQEKQEEIVLDRIINKKLLIKKDVNIEKEKESQIIVQINNQISQVGEDWFSMSDPLSPTKKKLFGISPNKISRSNSDIINNIYSDGNGKLEGRDLLSNDFFGGLETPKIPPKIIPPKDNTVNNNKDIKIPFRYLKEQVFIEDDEEEIHEDDLYNNEVSPLRINKNNNLNNFTLDNDDDGSLVSALSISDNDQDDIVEEENIEQEGIINEDYEIEGSEVDDMVNMNESFYT